MDQELRVSINVGATTRLNPDRPVSFKSRCPGNFQLRIELLASVHVHPIYQMEDDHAGDSSCQSRQGLWWSGAIQGRWSLGPCSWLGPCPSQLLFTQESFSFARYSPAIRLDLMNRGNAVGVDNRVTPDTDSDISL